jgi:hypothetical protein
MNGAISECYGVLGSGLRAGTGSGFIEVGKDCSSDEL